ncbi:nucleotidyltransferase [Clostridium sp. D2Q-14]|uniref:nucleotidyltransferase n=1 Tax=Anaeromonas gelatinilytica TaxID=2683194 RepID=UPI00193B78D6|nr:nucleotidyltransferase [Anaeromonas gelatinilytica]MBS4536093.1 nucleotidyltransferase [Anaeromonas gelatinilytica]
MNIVGLITEYNPFHNGHKYHLKQSKHETKCDYSISIMSGNFVQRGEPAIIDKWHRAKMAIDSGVDLVLELPTIYSTMSAEFFAYGAVRLLNELNVVDFISFGSETNNIKSFDKIANILINETPIFKDTIKYHLNKGLSYPKARAKTLKKILNDTKIINILNNPNNILAIEYMKALKILNSSIKPHSVQRIGAGYHDINLSENISSATGIRNSLLKNNILTQDLINNLPKSSRKYINEYLKKYSNFNTLANYNDILLYKLRTINPKTMKKFFDIEDGLENRIIEEANKSDNIISIINSVKTKRYAYTRLQRILIHILLDIKFEKEHILNFPLYARILGANSKGFKILNEIKNNSNISIINKVAHYKKKNPIFYLDIQASNIYFLGTKNTTKIKNNFDYHISPYIKTI